MLEMDEWLNLLTQGRRLRISVWCAPQIAQKVGLSAANQIHRSPLCDYIKSTEPGLRSCMRCREGVERYCRRRGAIGGFCPHGLYEYAEPIFFQAQDAGTVFVGNLLRSREEAERRTRTSAARFGLSEETAVELLSRGDSSFDDNDCRTLARAVADLMIALLKNPLQSPEEGEAPLVSIIKKSVCDDVSSPQTLKALSREYHVNEKYLGQLFKAGTGIPFAEFRNQIRLKRAANLLTETDDKILDIALSVGYSSASYFNRRFMEQYGIAPNAFRKRYRRFP